MGVVPEMPVERHGQDREQDVIRLLQARVRECEQERAARAAATERAVSGLRAEVWMLKTRISEMLALLEAQQQAAGQAAEAGWRAGYEQRIAEETAPPPSAGPGERRHLRVVGVAGAAFSAAGRVFRHKAALTGMAAGTLVVAAALPHMHTAELRVHVPGTPGSSVVAQAYNGNGNGNGNGPPSMPPGQAKKSSPPGNGNGNPAPSSNGNGQGNGNGQATPAPSPSAAATSPDTVTPPTSPAGTPADTGSPSADPPGNGNGNGQGNGNGNGNGNGQGQGKPSPADTPGPPGTSAAACPPGP